MKRFFTLFVLLCAPILSADTWQDPETGITWRYGIRSDGSVSIQGVVGELPAHLVIPSEVNGYQVIAIGEFAFHKETSLQSVVIPEGVTTLETYAFAGCSSLKSVVIPEGVTYFFSGVFEECTSLESLVIPASMKGFGLEEFKYCSSLKLIVFKGDVPGNVEASSASRYPISYPFVYANNWQKSFPDKPCEIFSDGILPAQVNVYTHTELTTPKTMKVTYTIKGNLPTVKVRAVAWKDGVRSFANIIPVRTGEGIPSGERVTTNEEHSFVWDVASDWASDLDKVTVEILVQEGALLPQDFVTIPATETRKAMIITRNVLLESWLFDALVWCYAEGDSQLQVKNGRAYVNGTQVANAASVSPDALNYLYGKMGYKVLAGEDLKYAEAATRLDFSDNGLNQVSVKIEEE